MSGPAIPRQLLSREDESPDPHFYVQPRFVTHIDDATIEALTSVYRERLPEAGEILDLMSSWISHLPQDAHYTRVAGLGMNEAELAGNPRLTEHVVHDLNTNPTLPYASTSFDAVLIAVSVQYLVQPIDVFQEICRVLRPGGEVLVAISHRIFPTKAIALFRSTPPAERSRIVDAYLRGAGGFDDPILLDRSPAGQRPLDPLWVVAARRASAPTRP